MAADVYGCFKKFLRTKSYEEDVLNTPLDRCIGPFELTLMGVGVTITSVFPIIGMVIHEAGSAAFLSFILAGGVALLCALSYIELSCRIPKAGSSYTYTYIAVGELMAFVVGWSVWLEYLGSIASCAKGWSVTLNTLVNNSISNYMTDVFSPLGWPTNSTILAPYPDFIAFGLVFMVTLLVLTGARLSSWLITSVSLATLATIAVVIVTLLVFANGSNFVAGGFAPFGGAGIVAGAATGFYIFVGFDAQTIAAEEVLRPTRTIPIAVITMISLVTAILIIASVSLSLFTPYNAIATPDAALVSVFQTAGMQWASYVSGIGGMLGLTACVLMCSFTAPRIIFAVSRDGLMFKFMSIVWERTQVPLYSIIVSGAVAGVAAMLLQYNLQINLTLLTALVAYSLVGTSVIALRYIEPQAFMNQTASDDASDSDSNSDSDEDKQADSKPELDNSVKRQQNQKQKQKQDKEDENSPLLFERQAPIGHLKVRSSFLRKLDENSAERPNTPFVTIGMFIFLAIGLASVINFGVSELLAGVWWAIFLCCFFGSGMIVCVVLLLMYQQNDHTIRTFKVPLVPIVPCVGITVNLILLLSLDSTIWLSFAAWLATGMAIYLTYGLRNSEENKEAAQVSSNCF